MTNEFTADPHAIFHWGTQMGENAEAFHVKQQRAHQQAQEAHAGWVGNSAATLAHVLDIWQEKNMHHTRRLSQHHEDLQSWARDAHRQDISDSDNIHKAFTFTENR